MTEPPCAPEATPTLRAALRQLPLLRIGYAHELEQDTELPPFKGAIWHGMLGACLHEREAQAYTALFGLPAVPSGQGSTPISTSGPDAGSEAAARRWSLGPPLDPQTRLPRGSRLYGTLTLMGEEGLTQAAACLGALHDLGRSGLGPQRGSARLCELAQVLPDGRWLPLAGARSRFESVTAADLWDAGRTLLQQRDAAPAGLTVELLTPLRLRRNGQDLREPPTLEELWRRFSRRLVTLLPPNLPGGVFGDQEHPQWCDWARGCALEDCRTQRVHWERWSARQQRAMPFEGLLGSLQYAAPAAQALPWLHLAHWLQLGAKTTFGLGVLRALT